MSITAARLQAEVGADVKGFDAGMAHADKTVAAAPSKWGKALKLGAGVGLGIAAGVVVKGLAGAISAGFTSLREQGVVVAQTNAVIKSTGGAAHVTAAQIRELSNAIENKTAIDDKQVQAGANMLLTFTNIRNEAGKGNDIFNQSVSILADLSTAMGTDMKGGAIQLGKALNDPLTGITALTRVGVTFSAQQVEQIKNFEKAGKTAEAQKVILRELNKEFGGSGAAFAATDAGKAAKFQDAIEGIQQSIATGLLPVVTRVRDSLTGFLSDPATLGQAEALGNAIAGIFNEQNLKTAASLMTQAAGAVSGAIHLFSQLPPQVQALAVGAIALKKITGIGPLDIAKGAAGLLKIAFQRGETPANPLFVAPVGGGLAGGGGLPGGSTSKLGTLASAATKVFMIGAAVGAFAELKGIFDEQDAANHQQGKELVTQAATFGNTAGAGAIQTSLNGISTYTHDLWKGLTPEAIAYQLNIGGVKDSIDATKTELNKSLVAAVTAESKTTTEVEKVRGAVGFSGDKSTTAAEKTRAAVDTKGAATVAAVQSARVAQTTSAEKIRSAAFGAGGTVAAAVRIGSSAAAAAARNAGTTVSGAVRAKKSTFTVLNTIQNNVRVSNLETIKTQTTFKTMGNTYIS